MIDVTSKHPFLVAMVDGTLPQANFQYYVVQDALYLQDFADCLRRLAATAPTPENATRLEAFAKGAEEAEMALHNSFFKEWNITQDASNATQMPNCLLYTSYMKRVVTTQSHAQGLAALLPCFWVYMHVGHIMLDLRKNLPADTTRPASYDAWIDMYGGEDFEREVKDYIAMCDQACQAIVQSDDDEETKNKELLAMYDHFFMNCKLEHMFWDQAHTMMQWPKIGGM